MKAAANGPIRTLDLSVLGPLVQKDTMDASEWDGRYEGKELVWNAGPNQFLPDLVKGLSRGRALDVATGEGRNAVWLAEQGWQVTGVDFSAVGIAKATAMAAEHGVDVEWIVADLSAWHPPAEAFDLIVEFYLHVPASVRTAIHRSLAAGLAPGGRYIVVGHDLSNLTQGVGGPPSPEVLFTPEDLAGDFLGLTIDRTEVLLRPVEDCHARDALMIATKPAS